MSQIEFETDKKDLEMRPERILDDQKKPSLNSFLVNHDWAKDEKQANIILLSIVGIFLLSSFFIFWKQNRSSDIVTFPDGTKVTSSEYIKGLKSGLYK